MTSLIEKIQTLKTQRHAVILAHNYQIAEVQDIADFVGDSLELSRKAAATDAEVIVFCGVHFMAETAAILSPNKTVLLPDPHAGCPMADMITASQLDELKTQHPRAAVVCYVNSTAAVKARCDMCCTSANAVRVVESIDPDRVIIFVPDKYLGQYVSQQTGRELILWPGYCPTHARMTDADIAAKRRDHPGALVMAHPECSPAVRDAADAVLSTGGMCRYAHDQNADTFIVATEPGILYRLRNENPARHFYPASDIAICPNMKRITLEKVLWSLERMEHCITVDPDTTHAARAALDAMLAVNA